MNLDDLALLHDFAARQSESAFATLVQRHLGLVHSAARRQTRDEHLAEEVTQAVFLILARKAPRLGAKTILPAWLYRTTCYVAAGALKQQRRRQAREQEAYMQSTLERGGDAAAPDAQAAWEQLAPELDTAMAALGERDRAALVLRFFENRPWQEVAALLRVTEDAAQKRVDRALDKLRLKLAKAGVTLGAAAIAGAMATNSVSAAPVALGIKVSVVAAKGAVVSTSLATLVNGTLKTLTWVKIKTGTIAVSASLIITTGLTIAFLFKHQNPPERGMAPAAIIPSHAVRIIGNISYKYFNKTGNQINSSTSSFEVLSDGIGWRLTAKQSPSDNYTIASDGTNTFSLISPTNEAHTLDSGLIDSVNFPIATPAENIPWLFYAFSPELNSKAPNLPTPWGVVRFDYQAWFCTRVINWSKVNPNLIGDVTFYYSSNQVVSSLKSPFIDRESPPFLSANLVSDLAQKMVAENMLAGKCTVLSWTNTPLGNFPFEFQVLVYSSLAEQERGEGEKVRIKIDGKMADISEEDIFGFLPVLKKPIYVRDYRFREPAHKVEYAEYGPINYWTKNKADVVLGKIKMVKTNMKPNHGNLRFFWHVFELLLLFIALLGIFVFKRKSEKKQKL